ncbi:MAG: hypothetical protein J9259_03150 [Thermoplasmata archaeon YP2-bin.285]|uniref:Uncharacterized protein n=1 Tax=Candidatus Sysuiplasma superficiale TaxID=2823368 RepID=A0A8J7YJR4_9ARCH|nr:hypothetical protein [Candidatus Sysuiplasma superficiale]
MLGKLLKTRTGRRIVVTAVVAVLIISGLAIYLTMLQSRHTLPSTSLPGSATVSGYPSVVNMSVSTNQSYTLTFTVNLRYVEGITISFDTQSPVTNATAYFSVRGSNWNVINGGKAVQSTLGEMPVGFTDRNISVVVSGNENASGKLYFYEQATLGSVSPSFVTVNVTSYHPVTRPPVTQKPSISLTNLPATVTVQSGSSGSYVINYTAVDVRQPLTWSTNQSWMSVSTVNSTTALASFTAPVVTVNTTYVANISVLSANGATNSSTLTVIDVISPVTVHPVSRIELDNLPATITVQSGAKGTFIINYTAVNASQPLTWTANASWVNVSTHNGTAAYANYTAPVVSANISFTVKISVVSSNNVSNSSTITFNVLFEKPVTAPPTGRIIFRNLPATVTVPSGATGTYLIEFAAINITGNLTWTSSVPWVALQQINSSSTDANYTAPIVIPPPLSPSVISSLFSFNRTFVVTITASSSAGIQNSSTLTFIVTATNTSLPRPNYLVYTSVCLSNSSLSVRINGGIHVHVRAMPMTPPPPGNMEVFMFYTLICLNNSEMALSINGGIHIELNIQPPAQSEFIFDTVVIANNSELQLNINGGITVGTMQPSPPSQQVRIITSTQIYSNNSEISVNINGGEQEQSAPTPAGMSSTGTNSTATLIYTSILMNSSEASLRISGGLHLSVNYAPPSNSTIPVLTLVVMDHSSMTLSVSGGLNLGVQTPPPPPPGPFELQIETYIFLRNSTMDVSIKGGFSVGIEGAPPPPPPPPPPQNVTVLQFYTLICLNNSHMTVSVKGGIHIELSAQSPSYTTIICLDNGTLSIGSSTTEHGNEGSSENSNPVEQQGTEAESAYAFNTAAPSVKIKLMFVQPLAYAGSSLYVQGSFSITGQATGHFAGLPLSVSGSAGSHLAESIAFLFLNPTGPPT